MRGGNFALTSHKRGGMSIMTTASAYHCATPSLRTLPAARITHCTYDTPHRQRLGRETRRISYTDRIYARLTMAGRVVAELTSDGIDGYTALLTMLRSMASDRRGLARLWVRNMTCGWVMERPLMLYGSRDGICVSAVRGLMPWDSH